MTYNSEHYNDPTVNLALQEKKKSTKTVYTEINSWSWRARPDTVYEETPAYTAKKIKIKEK